MDLSALDIYLLFDQICPATGKIRDIELMAGERMHRAGFLFPGDDDFVREVAYALGETPGLFADLPCDPREMIGRLDRSSAFLAMHLFFQRVARRCFDHYLIDRSTAVEQAMSAVQQVRAEGALPYPRPDRAARARAMLVPEHLLSARQRRYRQIALRRQRDRVQASGQDAAPPPSPQARAMAAYRRAAAQDQLNTVADAAARPAR